MPRHRNEATGTRSGYGARIKAARLAARMTQSQLAEAVGISHQQVSKYERDDDNISADMLVKFARVLKVDAASFYADGTGFSEAPQDRYTSLPDDVLQRLAAQLKSMLDTVEAMIGTKRR